MFNHEMILNYIDDIFGHDMHAKQALSLANATLGVIELGSLAIHAISNGLSLANGMERKHAVKQVDRLLTNTKLNVWNMFDDWVTYVVAQGKITKARDFKGLPGRLFFEQTLVGA